MSGYPIIASYAFVKLPARTKPIEIVCNKFTVNYEDGPKKVPKYRKVGKETKKILLDLVDSGFTIVKVMIIFKYRLQKKLR